MSILSVNEDLENSIKSDANFLYSHLRMYLPIDLADATEISGQSLEPFIVGSNLESFEGFVQNTPKEILLATQESFEFLADNTEALKNRKSLQSLFYVGNGNARPITGLPAIILLADLVRYDVKDKCFMYIEDYLYEHHLQLRSYLNHNQHNFCACIHDSDTQEDISEEYEDRYIQFEFLIEPFNKGGYTPIVNPVQTDSSSSHWFSSLIQRYNQGKYDLRTAVKRAQAFPYTFSMLVAPILGISYESFEGFVKNDNYQNLPESQRYTLFSELKPLIEVISFEYMVGDITSL